MAPQGQRLRRLVLHSAGVFTVLGLRSRLQHLVSGHPHSGPFFMASSSLLPFAVGADLLFFHFFYVSSALLCFYVLFVLALLGQALLELG